MKNISDLKESAQKRVFLEILNGLIKQVEDTDVDDWYLQELLEGIIEVLDYHDQDDMFGTEGWRHSFLGEE